MLANPADTPVTMHNDEAPAVPVTATEVLLLVQMPPPAELTNVPVPPLHSTGDPEMADGVALMVTIVLILHPVGNV
jgi:hypothetical protein